MALMNVTLINKSHVPTAEIQSMLDQLAPKYAETTKPVRITVISKMDRPGVWGKAYWPIVGPSNRVRRVIKKGEYAIRIFVGLDASYPREYCYKKRAGAITLNSRAERLFLVIAHEMRHVAQFDECQQAWDANHIIFANVTQRGHFYYRFKVWEKKYTSGSCEVDAEIVAQAHTREYQDSLKPGIQAAA